MRLTGSLSRLANFVVIAMVCIVSLCDAQQLCSQALNVTPNKGFANLPKALQFLQEPGILSPMIERDRQLVVDGTWVSRSTRAIRNFPYIFVDQLVSEKPSFFRNEIIVKTKINRELSECWDAGDCSKYNLRLPARKVGSPEVVQKRESSIASAGSLPVSHLTTTVVPNRMKFSKVEIRSLVAMYNEIQKNYKKSSLFQFSTDDESISAIDREIANYAVQSEREFVTHFLLKSMQQTGYVNGDIEEIQDHIGAYYATNLRPRAFN